MISPFAYNPPAVKISPFSPFRLRIRLAIIRRISPFHLASISPFRLTLASRPRPWPASYTRRRVPWYTGHAVPWYTVSNVRDGSPPLRGAPLDDFQGKGRMIRLPSSEPRKWAQNRSEIGKGRAQAAALPSSWMSISEWSTSILLVTHRLGSEKILLSAIPAVYVSEAWPVDDLDPLHRFATGFARSEFSCNTSWIHLTHIYAPLSRV